MKGDAEASAPATFDLRDLLEVVEAAPPAAAAEVMAAELAARVRAIDVGFWIADYSGRVVVRTDRQLGMEPDSRDAGRASIDESPHGRILRTQTVEVTAADGQFCVLAPVTNRGDALGVLELVVPDEPTAPVLDYIAAVAHALSFVVAANRQFTDLYEWGMRTTHFTLAAEIQRRLLPRAFACEAGSATLAAWIEPSHDIGGDTYDYCVDRGSMHLSITDAMGHDLQGAMLATLLVGALRNARRRDATILDQAESAHAALRDHAAPHQFVTGQLVRIDLAAGEAFIVNAGHPPPLRLRDGQVEELELFADLPFGLAETPYRAQQIVLQPGDRLVFLTDGMLERNAAQVDLLDALLATRDEHPREAVHDLTAAVVSGVDGDLRDDATVMCFDWYGIDQPRSAPQGATVPRVTPP